MSARLKPPLALLAPWFRWQRQRDQAPHGDWSPRSSRPVFVKYDAPNRVNTFLADPQRSFRFTGADHVTVLEGSPYTGKIRALTDQRLLRCDVRKLFRDTHKRSYLVVCELHCSAPGLPDAAWDRACEMGFVVRRRRIKDPDAFRARAGELASAIGLVRADLLRLTRRHDLPSFLTAFTLLAPDPAPGRTPAELEALTVASKLDPQALIAWQRLIAQLTRELADLRAQRRQLEGLEGVEVELQGWKPDPKDRDRGLWVNLRDERPQVVVEKVYPLFPLVPDPRAAQHSALGARLLFGNVPTGDGESDPTGEPHFDQGATYEIRCFVREHKPCCPRLAGGNDCHGPLVWSQPTEIYRLASHTDADGTANAVVNIELPDLPALAARPPRFGGQPVRMISPPGSRLSMSSAMPPVQTDVPGGPVTCTFSIPLITIVAMFVLNLFMPIVVFVFHLYYLLMLKCCFPPATPVDMAALAGLKAALDNHEDPDVAAQLDTLFPKGPSGEALGSVLKAEFNAAELLQLLKDLARNADAAHPLAPLGEALRWEKVLKVRPSADAFRHHAARALAAARQASA